MTRLQFMFATSIAATCCLLLTPGMAADDFDGKWTGTIGCAKLSFTKGPFKVPLEMTVEKGAATYVRDVYNKDGTQVVGAEEGSGTIGDGGKLTLTATWKSSQERPRYTYTASYSGTVAAKSANLKGTQVWKSVDGKTENRACTIALKR
jgi:hypothetical protein